MQTSILLVTTELPPLPGYPTAGGAIRAWGLAQALGAAGHPVHWAIAADTLAGREVPDQWRELAWGRGQLQSVVERASPDIILVEQWDPLRHLPPQPNRPVIVDIPGSLILENASRGLDGLRENAFAKLRALAQADLVLTATPLCRAWLMAWLTLAGWPADALDIRVVPVSLSPQLPSPPPRPEDQPLTAHFAGIAWPWQEVEKPLETIRQVMEASGRGCLRITTGPHPVHDVPGQRFSNLAELFHGRPRVQLQSLLPPDQLFSQLAGGDLAVDLMRCSPERELAATIRTIMYLWCGLPVLISNHSQLAPLVSSYDAGWVLDPEDTDSLARLMEQLLADPQQVFQRRPAARELARRHCCWDQTGSPLLDFCAAPHKREASPGLLEELDTRLHALEADHWALVELREAHQQRLQELQRTCRELEHTYQELDRTQVRLAQAEGDLGAIRGKWWYRSGKRVKGWLARR